MYQCPSSGLVTLAAIQSSAVAYVTTIACAVYRREASIILSVCVCVHLSPLQAVSHTLAVFANDKLLFHTAVV